MKNVRRKLWSRFWGVVVLVAVVSGATAFALAYEPNVVRRVRALGSFLERVPVVYKAPRKVGSSAAVNLPPVTPPPVPAESVPAEAPKAEPPVAVTPPALDVAAPAGPNEPEAQAEEWDESDELHSGEDEMPVAPEEKP